MENEYFGDSCKVNSKAKNLRVNFARDPKYSRINEQSKTWSNKFIYLYNKSIINFQCSQSLEF